MRADQAFLGLLEAVDAVLEDRSRDDDSALQELENARNDVRETLERAARASTLELCTDCREPYPESECIECGRPLCGPCLAASCWRVGPICRLCQLSPEER